MLTTAPHLLTRRPSPTTVEYTVSTSPPPTVALRLLIALTIVSRLISAFLLLFLLYSKYQLSAYYGTILPWTSSTDYAPPILSAAYFAHFLAHLSASPAGLLTSTLAAAIPLPILLPVTFTLLHLLTLRPHTSESLLILRGLGIQTSSSSASYLSSSTTRFIPTEKIQDILVNEAFRGWEVRYYLVVVVEGEESVVVVFPRLLPGRKVVESVWRGARGCLFEREKEEREREKGKEQEKEGGRERDSSCQ
jgi:phosphatidylinositol glycan class H protein